jgi:hypothetical protein
VYKVTILDIYIYIGRMNHPEFLIIVIAVTSNRISGISGGISPPTVEERHRF